MKERRTVEIDGDDFEVKGVGNWFIETDRKRYTWDEGEFNYSPDRIYPQGVKEGTVGLLSNRTARDIVLLTLGKCTAGTCWITWSDGMRALYNAPLIEDVSAFYAARSGEEAQAILRGMASVPGRIDDLGRKVEVVGRDAKEAAEGVREVPRMVENYKQVLAEPNEMAKEMYRMVWGQMDSCAADIAKYLDDNGWSQNKAAKHFKMSRNTIKKTVDDIIRPLYEKAGLPVPDPRKRRSTVGYNRDRNRGDVWEATKP